MSSASDRRPSLRRWHLVPLLTLALACALTGAASAQPFNVWLTVSGPTSGYIQVPTAADLNPSSAITIEAWVNITDPGGCSSIVGKNWTQAWWVGICGTTLRSYIRGYDATGLQIPVRTFRDAGKVPAGQWTHIAVTFDGTTRKHYINGELINSWVEPGALPATADAVRIASDVSFVHTPHGAIDEVRLWNVARTQDQIRGSINVASPTPTTGLVARWALDATANDSTAAHHNGTVTGSGINFFTFPVTLIPCSQTGTSLCLFGRFVAHATFRVGAPGTAESTAQTVGCANSGSGLFWFFDSNNWEVMVKGVNGCGLNSRYWIFSAATTNVFYRLEVADLHAGVNKVYFNYPGPPAPAVTDVNAFATCP